MRISLFSKISVLLFILSLVTILILSGFAISPFIRGDIVNVQSGSMENPDGDSIHRNDYVEIEDSVDDIRTYIEGERSQYIKAGSFGDVIVFHPNGDESQTPIIHRAVMYVEFNRTDLDHENGSYGGFDIPLRGEWNLKGTHTLKGYQWPESLRESGLVINFDEILRNFQSYGIEPHGGFITKGDDNPGVDQTSRFHSNDPPWIEPVSDEWVEGRYKNKVIEDPVMITCCSLSILPPILLILSIVAFTIDMNKEWKDRKKNAYRSYENNGKKR